MRPRSPDPQRLFLLMYDANGRGGVARTVLNLANHLARTREVEVLSLRRRREPWFPVDPAVRVTYLEDRGPRGRVREWLADRPSRLTPDVTEPDMSRLTDHLLRRTLRGLPPGIVVSSRPTLHLALANLRLPRLLTVGQDHLNFDTRMRNAQQVPVLAGALAGLDAFITLTRADARDYRARFPGARAHVEAIPNASPFPVAAPAPLTAKVVVSGGRLVGQKGFDRLVDAYAPIARSRPDWQLHIYGDGEQRDALARRIARHGVERNVILKGRSDTFEQHLADASVYALSSRFEGFPMVLLETMSKGVPPVAFDCPRGPAEIIDDGRTGRLVPDGDVAGFTAALLALIDDAELRRKLGDAALAEAHGYSLEAVGERWDDLFDRLLAVRRG